MVPPNATIAALDKLNAVRSILKQFTIYNLPFLMFLSRASSHVYRIFSNGSRPRIEAAYFFPHTIMISTSPASVLQPKQ